MPPLKPGRIYWDSDVFLSYFGKHHDRFSDLQSILTEVRESQEGFKIVTSVLAMAEVAYIAEEKTRPEDYPNMDAQPDISGMHPLQCLMSRRSPLSYIPPALVQ